MESEVRALDPILQLYQTHRQEVFRYLAGLTRNADLAEELVSETFCAALTALPRYRGDADVKTWLFAIARHKWYEHLRKKLPVTEEDLTGLYLADGGPGPAELAELRQCAARVQQLLAGMPPRTRRVVRMRMEGYSFYEIGQALAISEGSARVIDFRARAALRAALQKEGLYETAGL